MRFALFAIAFVAVLGGREVSSPAAEAGGYAGLPKGPGRDAVYFTCRACHSDNRFTRRRMSYEEWDGVITAMVKKNRMAEPEPWARTLILNYLSANFGVDEEDWQGLPPGRGREQVFYLCQACHSLAIVKQQGLSRDSWDESLVWMVEEQDMPKPDPADRKLMLDYLSENLGITNNLRPKRAITGPPALPRP